MTVSSVRENNCPEEMSLLTFSISGVNMGVDTDQVYEMMAVEKAGLRRLPMHHLPEKLSFGERAVKYHAPIALRMKGEKTSSFLVIDDPGDIRIVNVRSIRPLPGLIAQNCKSGAIWGTVIMNEQVVLLLDFRKLFPEGTPRESYIENHTDLYKEGGKV